MTRSLRLITIGVSHYCEKARWALDRAGLAYHEERHLPVFHVAAAKRASGRARVPILVPPEGAVVADSTAILRWVDAQQPAERRLVPAAAAALAAEVDALEDRYDEELGPAARLIGYSHAFPVMGRVAADLGRGAPRWERLFFRPVAPLGRKLMKKRYRMTPERVAEAHDISAAIFDTVAERLADGRPYLTGARFTAADLSFAALAGPLLNLAPGGHLLTPERMPAAFDAAVGVYRDHPAGQFVSRLYAEDRHSTA